jgi:hypothetical protein
MRRTSSRAGRSNVSGNVEGLDLRLKAGLLVQADLNSGHERHLRTYHGIGLRGLALVEAEGRAKELFIAEVGFAGLEPLRKVVADFFEDLEVASRDGFARTFQSVERRVDVVHDTAEERVRVE